MKNYIATTFERGGKTVVVYKPEKPPGQSRSLTRGFDAGTEDRFTADFMSPSISLDTDIRNHLRKMRSRSRELWKNESYTRRFVGLVAKNVVGPKGVTSRPQAMDPNGTLDVRANQLISSNWKDWGKRSNVCVTGRISWSQFQKIAVKNVVTDGEVFIRKRKGFPNEHGYSLQFIEPDTIDIDHNVAELRNGNSIRMGVEVNSMDRVVAFHALTKNPVDYLNQAREVRRERIPADQILHLFVQDGVCQTRGIPWVFNAIARLNMMGEYEFAELVAARVSASKLGFVTPSPENPEGFSYDDETPTGEKVKNMSPGEWEELPPGAEVKTFDPQHPTDGFDDFLGAMIRGVASSLGIAYHTLSGDLRQANYSSLRAGLLDERDTWLELQSWFIDGLVDPTYQDVTLFGLGTKRINLPFAKREKFLEVSHRGRRWAWVDPQKELVASRIAIEEKLKSRRQIIEEMGGDAEQTWSEIQEEEARFGAEEKRPAFGEDGKDVSN